MIQNPEPDSDLVFIKVIITIKIASIPGSLRISNFLISISAFFQTRQYSNNHFYSSNQSAIINLHPPLASKPRPQYQITKAKTPHQYATVIGISKLLVEQRTDITQQILDSRCHHEVQVPIFSERIRIQKQQILASSFSNLTSSSHFRSTQHHHSSIFRSVVFPDVAA